MLKFIEMTTSITFLVILKHTTLNCNWTVSWMRGRSMLRVDKLSAPPAQMQGRNANRQSKLQLLFPFDGASINRYFVSWVFPFSPILANRPIRGAYLACSWQSILSRRLIEDEWLPDARYFYFVFKHEGGTSISSLLRLFSLKSGVNGFNFRFQTDRTRQIHRADKIIAVIPSFQTFSGKSRDRVFLNFEFSPFLGDK